MNNGEFGKKLRELRRNNGLSQRELAEKVGINHSYISKIESGVMPPPNQKIIQGLAEINNADADELLILAGIVPDDIKELLKDKETVKRIRAMIGKNKVKNNASR